MHAIIVKIGWHFGSNWLYDEFFKQFIEAFQILELNCTKQHHNLMIKSVVWLVSMRVYHLENEQRDIRVQLIQVGESVLLMPLVFYHYISK